MVRLHTALALAVVLAAPAQGQQRTDTTRADYKDVAELLQHIPNIAPPAFDEARALWLGALPLSCLDRLQPRPGAGRGGGRANATIDTSSRADAAGRATRQAPPANNSGAGYFWVPTYSLVRDHNRLRAFWGCNDWHSAVASTWVAVRLQKSHPNTALRELTREKLNAHLGKSNLEGEIDFFSATAKAINPIPSASQTGLFERPYGFAWLLKLYGELRSWPDSQAQRWTGNVAPLAKWMADSLGAYYMKLVEPVRGGTLTNTANSMSIAMDYAEAAGDANLRRAIVTAARKLYLSDSTCATQSERVVAGGGRGGRGGAGRGRGRGANADTTARPMMPNDLTATTGSARGNANPQPNGQEILSPCLSEAALMGRVLDQRAYLAWLDKFLPPMESGRFAPLTEAASIPTTAPAGAGRGGAPADTSAAAAAAALANERARLAGLSFARAQMMERIARALPASDARVEALHRLSAIHADRGFALLKDDSAGISWLPAQALLYGTVRKQ
jgi:hypothetical protein